MVSYPSHYSYDQEKIHADLQNDDLLNDDLQEDDLQEDDLHDDTDGIQVYVEVSALNNLVY